MNFRLIAYLLFLPGLIWGMGFQINRPLEHLVMNNDMQRLMRLKDAQGVIPEPLSTRLKELSVKHKKLHILIATCSRPGCDDSVALTKWVTEQQELTADQVDAYYDALDLIKKRKKSLAQVYHKTLAQASARGKQLSKDMQSLCKEYLPHTEHHLDPQRMHPKLETAIIAGDQNKVQLLINQGCNLQASTADYMDALELATHHGKADMFRELIKHLPYISPHKQKVLLTYAKGEMIPVITKELPEYIARKDQELNALRRYNASHIIALLASGANPNTQNDLGSALTSTLLWGDLPQLKILLRNGANPNAKHPNCNLPTITAIINDSPECLKALLEHGANMTDEDGLPLINSAVIHASPASLKVLLEHGANPHGTYLGTSLLKWAEKSKKKDELVPLLKRYGARYTTLEKYPELIGVPLGICAGLVICKAQGDQITSTKIAIMGAGSLFGHMVVRIGRYAGSLFKN